MAMGNCCGGAGTQAGDGVLFAVAADGNDPWLLVTAHAGQLGATLDGSVSSSGVNPRRGPRAASADLKSMGACSSVAPASKPVVVDGVAGEPWGNSGRGMINPTRESQRLNGDVNGDAGETLSKKIARASIAALAEAIPTATQYRSMDEDTATKIAEAMFALFIEGAVGVRDTPAGKRVALELASRVKWKLDDAMCLLLGEADKAMRGDCNAAELRAFVIATAEADRSSSDDMKRGLDRFQLILDAMNKVKWDAEIAALEMAPAPSAAPRPPTAGHLGGPTAIGGPSLRVPLSSYTKPS